MAVNNLENYEYQARDALMRISYHLELSMLQRVCQGHDDKDTLAEAERRLAEAEADRLSDNAEANRRSMGIPENVDVEVPNNIGNIGAEQIAENDTANDNEAAQEKNNEQDS